MIVFSLRCGQGHVFDEWFSNSGEYESRKDAKELCCPECGDRDVAKAIMAPRIGKSAQPDAPSCVTGGGCGGPAGCAFHNH
ncbi:MAG: DUF1178 family protein [Rhodospirillales bacterium]|nr:DUF1178 family protein [Rhodospirillales bacterium]